MSKELLMKLRSKVPDTRYDTLVNMTINSSEETVEEVCRIICSDIDPQCIEKGIEILPYFKNLSRKKKNEKNGVRSFHAIFSIIQLYFNVSWKAPALHSQTLLEML